MTQKKLIYVFLGATAIALFFAYKKRNVPKPQEGEKTNPSVKDIASGTMDMNQQFAGMNGKPSGNGFLRPMNLIPNVYGRRERGFLNANGADCPEFRTTNIQSACGCASKRTVPPTMLTNFK